MIPAPSPQPSWRPRFRRPELRKYGTVILPRSGRRINGSDIPNAVRDGPNDRTPLLRQSFPTDESGEAKPRRLKRAIIDVGNRFVVFAGSEAGKGVFKCSLAYLLGTLATFVLPISSLLGQQDGKHMVATITVYFHPARTWGSMLYALMCAFVAFIYAAFISLASMGVSVYFEDKLHLLPLGHAIVLLVFCGGGLGYVGWVKQRLSNPLVNVACSLTSLAIITVLTKEGAVQNGDLSVAKISQVLKMLLMGVTATVSVCFVVYRLSARTKLRHALVEVGDSLSDMLGVITESFLDGSEELLEEKTFLGSANRNRSAFVSIDKFLGEAKLEHYVLGTEREYHLEKKLVQCIQDLTQSIGGLRSAAALQFHLLKQTYLLSSRVSPAPGSPGMQGSPSPLGSPGASFKASLGVPPRSIDSPVEPRSPADIFEMFIFHLGPSMRSLGYTLKEILGELPYGPAPGFKVVVNSKFRTSLSRALDLYRDRRSDALNLMYMRKDFIKAKSTEVEADLEEVAASCGHFSFSMQEFAEQLKGLLDILDELQLEVEERPGGRSWNWMKPWRSQKIDQEDDNARDSDILMSSIERKITGAGSPGALQIKQTLRYKVWRGLRAFRRADIKFAIKVGAGAAIYALPAFLKSTRSFYTDWRGEWGLLSYMLVCSMTIGASNTTGYARLFGTCLGAVCAVAAWYASAANVFGLAFFGWGMSLWTSYIILVQGRGPMGRFIMLTYNLVVLYAYSLAHKDSNNDQDEGGESPLVPSIAVHRVVAVLSGIIWGIIITRLIWPISARRELKHGLSLLWLRMSMIWKRDPLSAMTQGHPATPYLNPKEKREIQRFLTRLESLQTSAGFEFALKRPFPNDSYATLLRRTRRMLDAIQAMNLEIMKNLTASEGEAAMLKYTLEERKQISGRISHLLAVLASSMKLGYQLNDAPPDIDHSRDRLLSRLHQYRNDEPVSRLTTDEDYALLYAFALVTSQLRDEIMAVTDEVTRLFGVVNEDILAIQ